jgi:hypothetical protein
MYDLNTLLDPKSGAGWTLRFGNFIDDAGRIAGDGIIDGQVHAFVLTPVSSDRRAFGSPHRCWRK